MSSHFINLYREQGSNPKSSELSGKILSTSFSGFWIGLHKNKAQGELQESIQSIIF